MKLFARLVVVVAFLALAIRQLRFAGRYSVNLLFGDQWDFYSPLFKHQGWWQSFSYQHGPHRQGVGFLVTRILAGITGWNSRWDAIACSAVLIGAAGLGIGLARRFGVAASSLTLIAVPLIFLNVHQHEIFVGPSNLSHGAMPIFLFTAYCLARFIVDYRYRLAAVTALTFLLIFTGFGIFVGLITPVLLVVEGIQAGRSGERGRAWFCGVMLAACALSWALFLHGYTFQPAAPHFRFPYEKPAEYLVFICRMLANFYGVGGISGLQLVLGAGIALAVLGIAVARSVSCLRFGIAEQPRSTVLACLTGYTLLYCVNTAVGRVFLGPEAPLAPRYVTLLIPGALAIYLQMSLIRSPGLRAAVGLVFTLLLVPATAILRAEEISSVNQFSEGRRRWKRVYLRTHSELQANRESDFSIYPVSVGDRLQYLEVHRLNLFVP